MKKRHLRAVILIGITALGLCAGPVHAQELCRFDGSRLSEISGMATSVRHPGIVWVHNDSGDAARIYALDTSTCEIAATVRIGNMKARDLEAIASGRDARGRPVLWIADIGDNRDSWSNVSVTRIREPKRLRDATLRGTTFRFTYDDRPHDAEALLAAANAPHLWVVSKQLANGTLFALPRPLRADRLNVATAVRREEGLVTDGAVSPDGRRYVLRDYFDAFVFDGPPPGREVTRFSLPVQAQGEAIAWTTDGRALLIASERENRLLRVPLPAVLR